MSGRGPAPGPARGGPGAAERPAPAKILVVDDTPHNIRLLEAILLPRGYAVVAATSGPEALELVARERPDLVLLDIVMPGMDGHAACRRLRADPATARIPVVALTAFAMKDDERRFLGAGFDGYMVKPLAIRELPSRVRAFLDAASRGADAGDAR